MSHQLRASGGRRYQLPPMTPPIEGWRVEQEHAGHLRSSIQQTTGIVRAFDRYLDRPLLSATKDDVNAWLDSRPISAKTRYNNLSALSGFFRWAISEGLCEENPCDRIRRPKLRRYLPRPVASSDLEVALRAATPRMRAWLLLGAMEGLRCMEISNLDVQDVHRESDPPVLVVRGKGEKERVVPLHPLVQMAVDDACSHRPGPLFVSRTGRRFTPHGVSNLINRYLRGLGITATAHQLRHRFATDVYRLSRDIRITQELLGHASPATTAVYAAWSPKESAAVVRRLEAPALA